MKQNVGRWVDITGKQYYDYTAVEYLGSSLWLCRCVCGQERKVDSYALRNGLRKSCGCTARIKSAIANTTHGYCRRQGKTTPEYVAWRSMINRCYWGRCREYALYGGRGISVCDEWRSSFVKFVSDVGDRPSPHHSLDRIDVNGSYDPENVRWATALEQANNKANTIYVEYRGRRLPVCLLARELGVSIILLRSRILAGWDIERAISAPRRNRTPKHVMQAMRSGHTRRLPA